MTPILQVKSQICRDAKGFAYSHEDRGRENWVHGERSASVFPTLRHTGYRGRPPHVGQEGLFLLECTVSPSPGPGGRSRKMSTCQSFREGSKRLWPDHTLFPPVRACEDPKSALLHTCPERVRPPAHSLTQTHSPGHGSPTPFCTLCFCCEPRLLSFRRTYMSRW